MRADENENSSQDALGEIPRRTSTGSRRRKDMIVLREGFFGFEWRIVVAWRTGALFAKSLEELHGCEDSLEGHGLPARGNALILKERRQRYSASTNAENYNQLRIKHCRELKRAAVSAHEAKVPCNHSLPALARAM